MDMRCTTLSRSTADQQAARRLLRLLESGQDVRCRLVKRVRRSILDGYENALKWHVAIDRLLDELAIDGDALRHGASVRLMPGENLIPGDPAAERQDDHHQHQQADEA